VTLLEESALLDERRWRRSRACSRWASPPTWRWQRKAADVDAGANELWRARADLYLTILDLHSLTGDDVAKIVQGNGK